jgi:hypothetical protein
MPGIFMKIDWKGRSFLWIAAAVEIALALAAAFVVGRDETFPVYLSLYLAMSVPWLAGSYFASRATRSRGSDTTLVLGVAVILRAFFLVTEPVLSDDAFRYVWDGRVQHAEINPYLYAPDDPRLAPLRDELPEIYAGINNKDIPTLYPPLMQFLFYAATAVSSSLLWMKALFTLFDLALILALARLLESLDLLPLRALIYGWSPLPVVEIAGSGHNDVAAVFFLVASLWAFERGRERASVGLAVASGLAKLAGLALLPFFARFVRLRTFWVVPLATAVAVLPYASAGGLAFRGLSEYALRWRGNDSLFHFVFLITGTLSSARLVVAAILGTLTLVLFWRKTPPLRASFWLLGAILLLAPTVHPWYLLWIAPLLAVFPNPAWLFLEASVALSYHAAYLATAGEPWQEVLGIKLLEYGPFFILLGLNLLKWALHGSRRAPQDPRGGRARGDDRGRRRGEAPHSSIQGLRGVRRPGLRQD